MFLLFHIFARLSSDFLRFSRFLFSIIETFVMHHSQIALFLIGVVGEIRHRRQYWRTTLPFLIVRNIVNAVGVRRKLHRLKPQLWTISDQIGISGGDFGPFYFLVILKVMDIWDHRVQLGLRWRTLHHVARFKFVAVRVFVVLSKKAIKNVIQRL